MDVDPQDDLPAIAESLSQLIHGCTSCAPYDREDGVMLALKGPVTDLRDLARDAICEHFDPEVMDEDKIEALLSDVCEMVTCGDCGAQLDEWSEIALEPSGLKKYREFAKVWRTKHGPALSEFEDYLSKYPYLGAQHSFGKQLIAEATGWPNRIIDRTEQWYRARAVSGAEILTAEQLGPPPRPPSSEGRFTHHGQTALYAASDADTACAEVLGGCAGIAWVLKFELTRKIHVLDLTAIWSPEEVASYPIIFGGLMFETAALSRKPGSTEWKPEYMLPRFLGDIARSLGMDGILYDSRHTNERTVVIFDPAAELMKPLVDPKLQTWSPEEEDLIDF